MQQGFANRMGLGQLGLNALDAQQQARMGLGGQYANLAIGRGQAIADAAGARAAGNRGVVGGIANIGGQVLGGFLHTLGGGGMSGGGMSGGYRSPYAMDGGFA